MNIFITFWNGDYVQFDECETIDCTLGLVRILDDYDWFEYPENDIKEIIFVNQYTLSYAKDLGYEP